MPKLNLHIKVNKERKSEHKKPDSMKIQRERVIETVVTAFIMDLNIVQCATSHVLQPTQLHIPPHSSRSGITPPLDNTKTANGSQHMPKISQLSESFNKSSRQ